MVNMWCLTCLRCLTIFFYFILFRHFDRANTVYPKRSSHWAVYLSLSNNACLGHLQRKCPNELTSLASCLSPTKQSPCLILTCGGCWAPWCWRTCGRGSNCRVGYHLWSSLQVWGFCTRTCDRCASTHHPHCQSQLPAGHIQDIFKVTQHVFGLKVYFEKVLERTLLCKRLRSIGFQHVGILRWVTLQHPYDTWSLCLQCTPLHLSLPG